MGSITADTLISDVLEQLPGAARVFEEFGLGCPSCLAASMETLSAVALGHDVSVEELLSALNAASGGARFEERA